MLAKVRHFQDLQMFYTVGKSLLIVVFLVIESVFSFLSVSHLFKQTILPTKNKKKKITFESPTNASKIASVANVAAKGMIPPVINLAKQAISGLHKSSSAADCKER